MTPPKPLDTRVAQEFKQAFGEAGFTYPFEGYDGAFAVPMQRAREALRGMPPVSLQVLQRS